MSPFRVIGLLLLYLFHAVSLSHLCPSRYGAKKTIVVWTVLILCSVAIGLCLLRVFPLDSGADFTYFITILFNIFVIYLLSGKQFSKAFFFFLSYAQAFTAILFFSGFLAFQFLGEESNAQIIIRTLLHLVLTILCVVISKRKLKQFSQGFDKGWWPLNCLSCLLLLYLSYISLRVYSSDYSQTEIVFFVLLLSIILAVYAVFFHTIHLMYHAAEKQRAELQSQFLLRQVETMQESIDEARRIRHDARHHTLQILEYLKNGEYDALEHYLGAYEKDTLSEQCIFICSNVAANSILSAYTRKAQQSGIAVHLNVTMDRDIAISNIDIVAILANLMENAIHGCLQSKCKQPSIEVFIGHKVNKLVIYVRNTAGDDIVFENGLPKSKSGGGIGVKSILHSAARYGGEYDFRSENGLFVCQVLLKMPKCAIV